MSDWTVVYVADYGLMKLQDDISIPWRGVVRAEHPAIAKYPDAFRPVEIDANGLARMDVLRQAASLDLLIDFVRPIGVEPVDGGTSAASPLPRRGAGRPGWTEPVYRTRWHEAISRGQLSARATVKDVAPHFELLNGPIGAEPPYLARLDRRYRRDETPE